MMLFKDPPSVPPSKIQFFPNAEYLPLGKQKTQASCHLSGFQNYLEMVVKENQ